MPINHYAVVRLTEEQTETLAWGDHVKLTAGDDYEQHRITFTINDHFGFLDEHALGLNLARITTAPLCGERYVSKCNDRWALNITGTRDAENIVPRFRVPTPEEAATVPFGPRIRTELARPGRMKSPARRLLFELFEFLWQDYGPKKDVA